jgi:hypothetical protein
MGLAPGFRSYHYLYRRLAAGADSSPAPFQLSDTFRYRIARAAIRLPWLVPFRLRLRRLSSRLFSETFALWGREKMCEHRQ